MKTKNTSSHDQHEFFDVDRNDLASDWFGHTKVYWGFAEEAVNLKLELDRAEAALKVREDEVKLVDAELYLAIRADPASFGIEKGTEPEVKACVLVQKKYREAKQAVYDATEKVNRKEHAYGMAKARVYTMDNKKSTLENVTKLRLSNFWSEPQAPKDANGNEVLDARKALVSGKKRKN